MENFERQKGIAFLLISYTARNQLYYMRFQEVRKFWNRAMEGGRKSFRIEELNPKYFLGIRGGCLIPYLDGMNLDLAERE